MKSSLMGSGHAAVLDSHVLRGTASARVLLELGLSHGLSAEVCLRGTTIPAATMMDPLGQITAGQELRLIQNLVGHLDGVPTLGVEAGSRYRVDMFGILGFACMSAPRLRDVIDLTLRYQGLTFTLARARSTCEGDRTYVDVDASHLPTEVRRFVADQALTMIWTIIRELSESPPRPCLELVHESMNDEPVYREVFGVRPALGQPLRRIGFANGDIEALRPRADATALLLCEQGCHDLVTRRHREVGTTGMVRDRS